MRSEMDLKAKVHRGLLSQIFGMVKFDSSLVVAFFTLKTKNFAYGREVTLKKMLISSEF